MKAGKITRVLATIFLLLLATHPAAAAQASDFTQWLQDLEAEARRQGIRAETLEAALSDIEPIPRVVELDRQQPEFTLSFAEYRERVVPPSRIERGRKLLARHRQLLAEIGAEFGVQPRYIVALWGIETDFGRLTGGFPVIPALATLAHDGRRSDYFRGELLNALQILDEGHISPAAMTGSWAGAMGQCQFMPSSFLKFSVDYDGDGRRDIWNTRRDVFASAANYLAESGWRDDQTWGRQVRLPADFDRQLAGLETRKLIGQWQELGVRRPDGSELPTRQLPASIIIPDEENQPELAYMVYENFRTTLKWNRSNYFALAVGLLSDAIAER
ncbi:MAG: lytic murein transglycosylase [Desulfurivibrio sp.]|nr:lytic murein transglycosylase [Desulfurivibrio sp.]